MTRLLPIALAATLLGGAAAAGEPDGCRLGTADDGRAYLLCETRDEVTLRRATGLAAPYDPEIAALVAHETRPAPRTPDVLRALHLAFGAVGRTAEGADDGTAAVTFGLGMRISDALRADVTADLWRQRLEMPSGHAFAAARPRSVGVRSVMATATWELPGMGRLTPHLSGSLGMAHVETTAWGAQAASPLVRDAHTGLALGIGGGVSVALQEGVHLDLGYRYTHVPDAGAAGSLSLHDVRLGIRLSLM
ncbi:outer membrane protein [Salinarimonas chemoclinalis]|uniref:outer membrane protein n=1 Tax=Salinarimonas chemoclinalis TaxID=3241599 RepID=UPI00355757AA